jgi:hypothetical protein
MTIFDTYAFCALDDGFTEALRVNLQRLIVYAKSADTSLQREVAEKLANEAVKRTSLSEAFHKHTDF